MYEALRHHAMLKGLIKELRTSGITAKALIKDVIITI